MTCRPALRFLAATLWICVAAGLGGCSPAGPTGGTGGGGGSPTTGGATANVRATGGNPTGSGGHEGTGGKASTGGNAGSGSGGSFGSGGVDGRTSATGGSGTTSDPTAQGGTAQSSGGRTGGNAAGGVAGNVAATGGRTGSSTGGASGGTTTAGTTGNATGGNGGGAPFVLAWQDDFNSLDTSLWQAQSFTWDGNQAQFTPQNVSVGNGRLTLALTSAPSGSAKPYLGVELRSAKTLTYGKVSASMRFAAGSGVVSGLVLFYTPYPNCDWNEIDIEHLGNSSKTSQLNCMVFSGTPTAACTTSVTPTQDPQVVDLGFDAETAFHQYDIEWTPTSVKFFIDGNLLRTWTANVSRLKLPLNILLTIWASNSASWAGALNTSSAPTSAEVDWIKVYNWKG